MQLQKTPMQGHACNQGRNPQQNKKSCMATWNASESVKKRYKNSNYECKISAVLYYIINLWGRVELACCCQRYSSPALNLWVGKSRPCRRAIPVLNSWASLIYS